MDNNIISERLKKLLMDKQVRQKDLAEYLGITSNTVSYFITGKRRPNLEQIVKIANFFSVSTDYLMGLSDVSTTDKDIKNACELTGLSEETIKYLSSFKSDCFEEAFIKFIDLLIKELKDTPSFFSDLMDLRESTTLYCDYLYKTIKYFLSDNQADTQEYCAEITDIDTMIKGLKFRITTCLLRGVENFSISNIEGFTTGNLRSFENKYYEVRKNGKHTRTEE